MAHYLYQTINLLNQVHGYTAWSKHVLFAYKKAGLLPYGLVSIFLKEQF